MKNVYIITKEGRKFSTKGLNAVRDMLKQQCNETDDLNFVMGQFLNDKTQIIPELEKHAGNMYIVASENEGEILHRFGLNGSKGFIKIFKENMQEETWVTIMKTVEEIRQHRAEQAAE